MMNWVSKVIIIQFILVLVLAAYTFCLLFFRRFIEKRNQLLREEYQELLAEEMMDLKASTLSIDRWLMRKFNRPLFHEVILVQMKMVAGEERDFLLLLYTALRFKADDVKRCNSMFWAQRLKSILDLGLLELADLAPLFHEMILDEDPLVSMAALLSLSKLKHPLNSPALIRSVPDTILSRSNVLYELVSNVGVFHGVEPLVWAIRHHKSPRVATVCIQALRQIRSLEATEALNRLLSYPDDLTPASLREIIETLTQIGDPSSLPYIRRFLNHLVTSVRAESALSLLILQDEVSIPRIKEMRKQPDVELKRIFQIYDALLAGATA